MSLLLLAAALTSPRCGGEALATANGRYAALVQAMDLPAIGALFLADGAMVQSDGTRITGPAQVVQFLGQFSAYHVSTEAMEIAAITALPSDGWQVSGRYEQHGTTPAGAPYAVTGTYQTDWACHHRHWRIARTVTKPAGSQ